MVSQLGFNCSTRDNTCIECVEEVSFIHVTSTLGTLSVQLCYGLVISGPFLAWAQMD